MKKYQAVYYLSICCLIGHFCIFQSLVSAEESIEESIDCTEVKVDYVDDASLTREERLRRMDEAFFESLNRFELCQEAKEKGQAAASAPASADGGSGGSDGEAGTSGEESVASTQMSGTETPQEYPPAEGFEALEPKPLQSSQEMDETTSKTGGNVKLANGKTPDDIPSAENDDALAAQIRHAAENEPDPVKSRQLWNEYRKYKGLATK